MGLRVLPSRSRLTWRPLLVCLQGPCERNFGRVRDCLRGCWYVEDAPPSLKTRGDQPCLADPGTARHVPPSCPGSAA